MNDFLNLWLLLFTAHVLGDFAFQNDCLAKAKCKWYWLLVHTIILTVVAFAITGVFSLLLYVYLFVSHIVIDALKCGLGKDGVKTFIADQCGHLIVLTLLAYLFAPLLPDSVWAEYLQWYLPAAVFISGLVLAVNAGNVLISKAVTPFLQEISSEESECEIKPGLTNGGKLIGQLERFLTFLLILVGQFGAIGFLFAAKSILRFGEIRNSEQRKQAEYIIIGTFMSFSWAVSVSIATKYILTHLAG